MTALRVAVLDACVLYPVTLRDFLVTLATIRLYEPRWTELVHDEWMRSVLKNRPDLDQENLQRICRLMDEALPKALIGEMQWQASPSPPLPDPGDHHVVSAAIAARATAIVTFNLRDFPAEVLHPLGITAVHPDAFVAELLRENSAGVLAGFELQRARFRNPPRSRAELLEILEKRGLADTVSGLRRLFNS